jgi:hypothetical protein
MAIQQDFKELLELLNAHAVEYVIVGAQALAFYGVFGYTGDMEVRVRVLDIIRAGTGKAFRGKRRLAICAH